MIEIKLQKTLLDAANSFELNVDFCIEAGQFISIYGKSGAGKTSLLRLIAGLDQNKSGKIKINNSVWSDSDLKVNLPPQKRKVGMVFQDYALFPNMTVKENLEFALEKDQSATLVNELLDTIELTDFQDRKPNTLSGGQKQRVALARALVQKPDVLLLDEPLSALDDETRIKLQDYILKVHEKYNLTTFLVSHDLAEVFKLSDFVIKLEQGKIIEKGTPDSLFLDNTISGKYKSIGSVLAIKKADTVNVVSVLTGVNIIKVISTNEEVQNLEIGDKVLIASKAFNPILIKV